jgi:uncharacterized protein (DUF1697 family)
MNKYIAFLRGINVGGHKVIKMEDLNALFTSLKFKNVKTFIQSGNVIFETEETNEELLTQRIEKKLQIKIGSNVSVLLRNILEIEALVKRNPFKNFSTRKNVKMYVTFLYSKPHPKPKLPLISSKKDVEVFEIINREACSLSLEKNGRFGFPNLFIEKEFDLPATTRNWTTVCKILQS